MGVKWCVLGPRALALPLRRCPSLLAASQRRSEASPSPGPRLLLAGDLQPAPGEQLAQQTYDDVAKAIEGLPATRGARWSITCGLHRPQMRELPALASPDMPSREMFTVSLLSDQPPRHFVVMRHEHVVVEAGAALQPILDKLQLYRHRMSMSYEGFEYSFGEFLLRVGRATSSVNEVLRGVLMEVELKPTESMRKASDLMKDFVAMWQEKTAPFSPRGSFVLLEPNYTAFGLSDTYFTPMHSALQYVLVSAHFMAGKV